MQNHNYGLGVMAIAAGLGLASTAARADELDGFASRSPSGAIGCRPGGTFNSCTVAAGFAKYRVFGFTGSTGTEAGKIRVRTQQGLGTGPICTSSWGPPGASYAFNGRPAASGNGSPFVAAPVMNWSTGTQQLWVTMPEGEDISNSCTINTSWRSGLSNGWYKLPDAVAGHKIGSAPGSAFLPANQAACPVTWVFAIDANGGAMNRVMSTSFVHGPRSCGNFDMNWGAWDLSIPPLLGGNGEKFISSPAVSMFAGALQVWAFTKDSSSTIRLRQIVYQFGVGWLTSNGDWFQLALPKSVTPKGAPALTSGLFAGVDRFWIAFTDTTGTIYTQRFTAGGAWNSEWVALPNSGDVTTGTPTFVWREGWGEDTVTEWLSVVMLRASSNFLAESRKWSTAEAYFDVAPAFMGFAPWVGLATAFYP
jgi:hypothetical protein